MGKLPLAAGRWPEPRSEARLGDHLSAQVWWHWAPPCTTQRLPLSPHTPRSKWKSPVHQKSAKAVSPPAKPAISVPIEMQENDTGSDPGPLHVAPKGTQVATGSSTKLPGSSAPTKRPYTPGARRSQLAARQRRAVQRSTSERNPAAVAAYGGAAPLPGLRAAGFN
jgi:hypothetical protein